MINRISIIINYVNYVTFAWNLIKIKDFIHKVIKRYLFYPQTLSFVVLIIKTVNHLENFL